MQRRSFIKNGNIFKNRANETTYFIPVKGNYKLNGVTVEENQLIEITNTVRYKMSAVPHSKGVIIQLRNLSMA